MLVHIAQSLYGGLDKIQYLGAIIKSILGVAVLYVLKLYFNGATNTSDRKMHSRVIMMTVSARS